MHVLAQVELRLWVEPGELDLLLDEVGQFVGQRWRRRQQVGFNAEPVLIGHELEGGLAALRQGEPEGRERERGESGAHCPGEDEYGLLFCLASDGLRIRKIKLYFIASSNLR